MLSLCSLPYSSFLMLPLHSPPLCGQLSELRLQGWLSDEEEAAVEYLHELEQAYPMTCVDVEQGGGAKRKGWRWVGLQ